MEPKILSEQHVSMMPGKLKAHTYFGLGNKFQGSLKSLAAQHEQKSLGLPGYPALPGKLSMIIT
jgi:hypothetical protein